MQPDPNVEFALTDRELAQFRERASFFHEKLTQMLEEIKEESLSNFKDADLSRWREFMEKISNYEIFNIRYERVCRRLGMTPDPQLPFDLEDYSKLWRKAGSLPHLQREAQLALIEILMPQVFSNPEYMLQPETILEEQCLMGTSRLFHLPPKIATYLLNLSAPTGAPDYEIIQIPMLMVPFFTRPGSEVISISDLSPSQVETLLVLFGGAAYPTLTASKDAAVVI